MLVTGELSRPLHYYSIYQSELFMENGATMGFYWKDAVENVSFLLVEQRYTRVKPKMISKFKSVDK